MRKPQVRLDNHASPTRFAGSLNWHLTAWKQPRALRHRMTWAIASSR
ncbi:hypothetical protein FHY19_002734 [Xanthomonas arboricola]|nr:hypothetical protein [Xanthomonas sp. 4461]